MNKCFKTLLFFFFCLLYPDSQQSEQISLRQSFKRDTVGVKPTIVNNPTATFEGIKIITVHHTLLIKETTIRPGETVTDIAAIGKYVKDYFQSVLEIVELKKTLLALQLFFPKTRSIDSYRNKYLKN